MKWKNLETEAKNFRKSTVKDKPLTTRRFFAGQALAGLIAKSKGSINMVELRREAYELADFMLEKD